MTFRDSFFTALSAALFFGAEPNEEVSSAKMFRREGKTLTIS